MNVLRLTRPRFTRARFTAAALVALLAPLGPAHGSAQAPEEAPLWLRYPAISPDGSTLVFTYRGDLYRVPAAGGRAVPLTVYPGTDFMPVWSPDGRHVAFASDRTGNLDVWIVPAEGGTARRLTWHSADDRPWTFSPDGERVLFSSGRLDRASSALFPSLEELYEVPVAGGPEQQVLTVPAEHVTFDATGRRLLFQDHKGYEDPWRKHHTSSITRDLWLHDLDDGGFRRLTTTAGEDRNGVFTPDGQSLVYLSAGGDGIINVVRAPLADPDRMQPLTSFDHHPVRFLTSAADGTLAFSWNGELYTLVPGAEPRRVPVRIAADLHARPTELIEVTSGAADLAISPSGKEAAFIHRGEVFVTSLETSTTKQVTRTPEQERSVSFAPDGKSLVYAGERDGSWNLYRTKLREGERYFFTATVLEEEALLATAADEFQPAFSPDGKALAFLEDREILRVLDLESGDVRTVLGGEHFFSYADGDQYFQWSPDSKWLLVQYLLPGYWSPEVGLVRADASGQVVNLTRSGYSDGQPKWAMGGKMMLWQSNRDGLRSAAGSGSTQADVYGMFFTQDAWDRFQLSKEEFELLEEAEKEAKKDEDEEKDEEGDEDDAPDPVVVEMEGLKDRTARLTLHSSALSDAVVTPDGAKLLYLARVERTYDLWQTDLRTRETKVLADLDSPGGGSLTLDEDGENVFVLSGGRIRKVEIASGKATPVGFAGEMVLDPTAEREHLFEHAWRQVREKFLVSDLHGADWDFLEAEYARFLPHVGTDRAFAEMLAELLGELNASHTGARYRHQDDKGDETASLGVYFDPESTGPGLRVAEVMKGGPLAKAGVRAAAGDVLVAVDGTPLDGDTNLYALLNRKAGKNTLLSFRAGEGSETWTETVKPITLGAEGQLVYRRWVERRRALTDSLSGGRIGYVHVRSMSDPSYRTVVEEVMGEQVNKEAVVIDARFNGGGDLVDDIVTFFDGPSYMDFVAQDGQLVGSESQRRWQKPSIMLVAEGNYSDAHCTPWAYQHLELGKLVGMPVPGTCSFVWWESMQNGVVFGIPNMAVTAGPGGRPLENLQLEPDVRVRNEYAAAAAGRDQQLEAAVAELLRELGGG